MRGSGTGVTPARSELGFASVRLPRHGLAPLYHADHADGLYGLFAIANALRLAVAGRNAFSSREIKALIDVGLGFLELRVGLHRGLVGGVRLELWRRMTEAMVYWTVRHKRMAMSLDALVDPQQPTDRQQAFTLLDTAARQRRLVLMLRGGGRYTVLTGQTEQSLLLFDSGAAGWISKRLTGVPGDSDNCRHIIYPKSFLALSY